MSLAGTAATLAATRAVLGRGRSGARSTSTLTSTSTSSRVVVVRSSATPDPAKVATVAGFLLVAVAVGARWTR